MIRFFCLVIFLFTSSLQGALFEDLNHAYSVEFPDDWAVKEKEKDEIAWVIATSSEKEGNVQMTYNERTSDNTLNEYLPEMLRYMKEKYADVIIGEIESATVDGNEAKAIFFKAKGPSPSGKKISLKALHYLLVVNKHLMMVLCVAPEKNFSEWQPTFEKIVASIKLAKQS